MNKVFIRSKDAQCIDLEDEGILYIKNRADKRHIANTTTMAIWDLLDGKNTSQDIILKIAAICDINSKDIADDVYNILLILKQHELIEEANKTM